MQLRNYWVLSRAVRSSQLTPLLRALYTEGVLYFVATISVRIWAGLVVSPFPSLIEPFLNHLQFAFLDPTYWPMTIVVDLTTGSTFISRIMLHLSKVSSKRDDEFTSIIGTTIALAVDNRRRSSTTWMEMDLPRLRRSIQEPSGG